MPKTMVPSIIFYVIDDTNNLKICPAGWHIPTDSEWTELIDYLDPANVNPNATIQSTVAGGKMKERGTAHWTVQMLEQPMRVILTGFLEDFGLPPALFHCKVLTPTGGVVQHPVQVKHGIDMWPTMIHLYFEQT